MQRIQSIKKNTKVPPKVSAKDAFKHITTGFFSQKKEETRLFSRQEDQFKIRPTW